MNFLGSRSLTVTIETHAQPHTASHSEMTLVFLEVAHLFFLSREHGEVEGDSENLLLSIKYT